jgi:23S rRNA G2445 N2-methylase RlmL
LYRRGYRLAAAMLLTSEWDGHTSLMDTFCGSGAIINEVALFSRGIPPDLQRRFAVMDWPEYEYKLGRRYWPRRMRPAPG